MKLLIVGAGGHGRVIADAAETSGRWTEIAFLDDCYPEIQTSGPWNILGKLDDMSRWKGDFHSCAAGFGDARMRLRMLSIAEEAGLEIPVIAHARAIVSGHARIEPGTVIAAGGVVNIGCDIGRGCIINTGATVDHDGRLARGVHICPGAHLGGAVTVGQRTWFGIGAVAKQGIRIGSDATVGAGAVCLKDVRDGAVVFGVPARERRNE